MYLGLATRVQVMGEFHASGRRADIEPAILLHDHRVLLSIVCGHSAQHAGLVGSRQHALLIAGCQTLPLGLNPNVPEVRCLLSSRRVCAALETAELRISLGKVY